MHDSDEAVSTVQMEMPRYVSHKKVWALEIATIMHNGDGGTVLGFYDKGYAPLKVPASSNLFSRYVPTGGDFYVVYPDGYRSFSPRKAFLEGYTAVTEPNCE